MVLTIQNQTICEPTYFDHSKSPLYSYSGMVQTIVIRSRLYLKPFEHSVAPHFLVMFGPTVDRIHDDEGKVSVINLFLERSNKRSSVRILHLFFVFVLKTKKVKLFGQITQILNFKECSWLKFLNTKGSRIARILLCLKHDCKVASLLLTTKPSSH